MTVVGRSGETIRNKPRRHAIPSDGTLRVRVASASDTRTQFAINWQSDNYSTDSESFWGVGRWGMGSGE
ncbi:MAG: hypothetical protein KME64_12960 [Scytonematopsis contorta HA4267-MV1]|nr:hypothetical protein [Scytonematopsis contorta HA4267-MV1]